MRTSSLIFLAILVFAPAVQAQLVFTAPPRETPEKGLEMYQPIADYLTKTLGEKVVYRHPSDWQTYSNDMRKDNYDIIFDGPHFGAWRIKHLGHQAAVKIPGELVFVIVTNNKNTKVTKLRHLKKQKVCGLASPNLGTVTYLANFLGATVPPQIVEVKGGFKGVYKAFRAGKCDAAILRDTVYKKLPAAEKTDLKVVHTSKPLPNQAVTVSKRVKDVAALTRAMMAPGGAQAADKLMGRFSKNTKTFLKASTEEYQGAEEFLEGVVWGW